MYHIGASLERLRIAGAQPGINHDGSGNRGIASMDMKPDGVVVGGKIHVQEELDSAADDLPFVVADEVGDDIGGTFGVDVGSRYLVGGEHHGSEVGDIGGLGAQTGSEQQRGGC